MSGSSSATPRDLIRWLLRPLGEPSLLRLVVEDAHQSFPLKLLEHLFWELPHNKEHPAAAKEDAWKLIEEAAKKQLHCTPVDWYAAIVQLLREEAKQEDFKRHLEELARFWSLPELFFPPTAIVRVADYHEVHCHFRGAVPFEDLWVGWLSNQRWRASLRAERVQSGSWKCTWATLVGRVVKVRRGALCLCPSGAKTEGGLLHRMASRVVANPQARATWVPYLAVCCGLRRAHLHQRTEAGLALFVKRFEKYSKVQKTGRVSSSRHTEDLAIAVFERFEKEGAVCLELRPTLERTRIELQRKLSDLARAYVRYLVSARESPGRRPVKLGLVPSLFKQEGIRNGKEPSPADWKRQTDLWRAEVGALLTVIRAAPALRYLVVGLDAAGKERGCPARAFAPAFELVHQYHRSAGLQHLPPGRQTGPLDLATIATFDDLNAIPWRPVRLGLTSHAGEDFVDPLTGLRHIAETIDALGLREHDRLGHALALALTPTQIDKMLDRRAQGDEVERGANGTFRFSKPRGEHLLDLAWALDQFPKDKPTRRLAAALLGQAAAGAFGAPVDSDRLAEGLRAAPHVETWLPAVRYDNFLRLGAADRVTVTKDKTWEDVFEPLRQQLLTRVARAGIVIESCPTSNCAVANLREAPIEELMDVDGLRVAIATDDPALFGAWPSHELERVKDPKKKERLLAENAAASFIR